MTLFDFVLFVCFRLFVCLFVCLFCLFVFVLSACLFDFVCLTLFDLLSRPCWYSSVGHIANMPGAVAACWRQMYVLFFARVIRLG